ncbi:hypothetical protein [Vagococcus fluvialis]|uniref:hypothetical protein n=1 Tax=Vagococcus fluvialis TaxID=2738 RepID=UPI001D0BB359|nr:hypothetical protein [Vagococcus fluvialis]UDM84091.1 hypothetical protein K5K96_15210 [Vagococcus fluvialis]
MFKIIGEKMVEVINFNKEFNSNLQKQVDNYLENLGLTHLTYLTKDCCLFYDKEKKNYYFKVFFYSFVFSYVEEEEGVIFNQEKSYITNYYSKALNIKEIEIDFENKEIYFDLSILENITKKDIEEATKYF